MSTHLRSFKPARARHGSKLATSSLPCSTLLDRGEGLRHFSPGGLFTNVSCVPTLAAR